jgi:hypothetical protein
MLNLKTLGRAVVATLLGAGLFVSFGIDTAEAGKGGPGGTGLIHHEGGFDFSLFDLSDGVTPFFVGPAPEFGSSGMLGVCPGCFDDLPNILVIDRPDGAPFAMTSFVGAAAPSEEECDGPCPEITLGVDYVVAGDPFSKPFDGGLLLPGLLETHPVSMPLVTEMVLFSPFPLDEEEVLDCLCFDSMTFDVFFDIEPNGPQLAAVGGETITVTFDVPEPAALSLLGIGLAGLAAIRRRRRTPVL